jgi:hypothetical protein
VLNCTSLAGLKLLVGSRRLIREDFCELYPLLPPNFLELRKREDWLQLDTLIKKRALGFLILCFVIRKVPELVDPKMLETLVPDEVVAKYLTNSAAIFGKVLKLFSKFLA